MREKRRKRGGIVTRDLKSTTEIFEIDDSYASTRRRMGKRCSVKNRICTPASTVFDRRRVVDSPADYRGS